MAQRTCSIEGCEKKVVGRGWCGMHWARWRRWGDPLVTAYNQPKPLCSVGGCDKTAYGRGMCNKHWLRWKRYGDPLVTLATPPEHFTNEICLVEGCDKPTKARGWCAMHYKRWRLHGSMELPKRQKKVGLICKIDGCGLTVEARGWCNKHYLRWHIHGDPMICSTSEIIESCWQVGCGRRLVKGGVCWTHYRYYKARFAVEQGNKCAICGTHADDAPNKRLHLDHCHATGQPRALLCHHCNVGIGHFKDNPDLLHAAIRYLAETKPGQLALFAS